MSLLDHLDAESSDAIIPVSADAEATRASKASNRCLKWTSRVPGKGLARHSIGIILLLITVILWTASNFLASTIMADNSYSKPYFVTYINSSFFSIFLVWAAVKRACGNPDFNQESLRRDISSIGYEPINAHEEQELSKQRDEREMAADPHPCNLCPHADSSVSLEELQETTLSRRLSLSQTARLSFEFCLLWFLANYFIAACLEYTTVASSTILTSTSSIFTLMIGAWLAVEQFTIRKLVGVLASLAGIILISSVDLTGNNDQNRGSFPHKTHFQLAIGDGLALGSALLYGIYTSVMKKRIGDESRVDMILFFGFVGLFNLVILLPGFPILHYLDVESFELPPSKRITTIVLINSATSLVSDVCWAYSMLLTSPLITTVGLSLSIPLSLFGQMILNHQMSSVLYWVGASIVLLSFVFINYEESKDCKKHGRFDAAKGNGTASRFKLAMQIILDKISPKGQ